MASRVASEWEVVPGPRREDDDTDDGGSVRTVDDDNETDDGGGECPAPDPDDDDTDDGGDEDDGGVVRIMVMRSGMTTVKEMWEKKDTYTARASEISRTLCLSGLAVVWIFRTPTPNGAAFLAPTLLWASGLIVLALLLDLL